VELWDTEDFDPWQTLRWETVRVFFYRQHKPDGMVLEAYWLTNFASTMAGPRSLFRMAKSRWEIENQAFNEAKSHHGLEHICHHHANSLLIGCCSSCWPRPSNDSTACAISVVVTHPLRSNRTVPHALGQSLPPLSCR
jgi:hypothetical protein